ncbi:winged helix-turn-helix transcriptional regulator [Tritonibacter scottomollicae]|uniref:winged helix-turn-helix transcriptional regulator n=1 Tax=Tritonibacter scottomollicae TaxID=483013 RepID=UPI003AA9CFEA
MLNVTALTKQEVDQCPVRQVLSRVTGKWQVLILLALEGEPLRFGALKRTIGDITQRVLTQNLRSLERDGYLTRTVSAGPPLAVTYALTELGKGVVMPLKSLVVWAADNHGDILKKRAEFDSAPERAN